MSFSQTKFDTMRERDETRLIAELELKEFLVLFGYELKAKVSSNATDALRFATRCSRSRRVDLIVHAREYSLAQTRCAKSC